MACLAIDCQTASTSTAEAKPQWLSEVEENGSGLSETQGVVSREWFCSGPERRVRRVSQPCAACTGMALQPYATVAVKNTDEQTIPCGATLYVHGVGTRTVVDLGNLAENQLDHYIGFTGCNQASSYGTRKVIRLY